MIIMAKNKKRIARKIYKFNFHQIVLFSPIFLLIIPIIQGKALFWGVPSLQFIPWEAYAWKNLLNGVFPFWNNLNGMGAPLMANYQLAIFYPPNWISLPFYAFGGTGWLAWSKNILVLFHLVWTGFGMYKLMKKLGFPEFSRLISAVSFQLCAYLVTRLGFFSMIWAASWIPWILFTASEIAFPGEIRKKIEIKIIPYLILCLVFQLLAGHAQLTWYTLVLGAFWVLIGVWTHSGLKAGFTALLALFYNVFWAVLLASIQLLPTAELLLLSQRSGAVGYETAMTYSFWPWRLLTLLAPNLFGSPSSGDYWGYASYWEDAIYLGIIPLIMVISTLKLFRSKNNGLKVLLAFLWGFSGLSVLFALGKNTPIFPFLYKYIPTFDMFNAPARFIIWLDFCFSILAGIGIVFWKKPEGKGLYWLRLGTAGGFAITIGAFLTLIFVGDVKTTFIKATALTGFWLVGVGILTLLQPPKDSKKRAAWQCFVIFWLLLDLISFGYPFTPFVQKEFYDEKISRHFFGDNVVEGHRIFIGSEDEYQIKFDRFLRFLDFQAEEPWINLRYVLIPNINMIEEISSANNFDPLLPSYYADFMEKVNDSSNEKFENLLTLMNVRVIEKPDETQDLGVSWNISKGDPEFIRWFSCAYFANSKETAEEKFDSIVTENSLYKQILVLEDYSAEEREVCFDPGEFSYTILEESPNKLVVKVKSSENGWLMNAVSWYPGWKVYIDGKMVSIYRADTIFRALFVENGEHTIEFTYFPIMFYTGLGTSLSTLILLVWILKFKRTKIK